MLLLKPSLSAGLCSTEPWERLLVAVDVMTPHSAPTFGSCELADHSRLFSFSILTIRQELANGLEMG